MAKKRQPGPSANGANVGFETRLWAAADKLRGRMDAAESSPTSATRSCRS